MTSTPPGLLLRAPQFEERVDHARAAAPLGAGQIARRLLDEGHKHRMQREIVGEVVQAGRKQQHVALADFLVEQQRRSVGQAGNDARVAGIDSTAK